MISRKYLRDYKLSESVTPGGRIRTDAVYVGDDWFFTAGAEALRREKRLLAGLAGLGWALWLAALLPPVRCARAPWAQLPLAACCLPLLYLSLAAGSFCRAKEPLTRRAAEQIAHRVPVCSLLTLILSGAAAAGLLASLLAGYASPVWGDGLFGVCAGGLCAAAAVVFSRRRLVRSAPRPRDGEKT